MSLFWSERCKYRKVFWDFVVSPLIYNKIKKNKTKKPLDKVFSIFLRKTNHNYE